MAKSILQLANEALAGTGHQLYTASQLYAMREDFRPSCAPITQLLRGIAGSGWRFLLGGAPSSGKTTCAKDLVKDHRRAFPERGVLWVDVEHAEEGNPHRAEIHQWAGDNDILILPWSGTGEGLFDNLVRMVKKGVPLSCVVIDSANGLVPRQEEGKDLDQSAQMAGPAAMFSKIFRVSNGILSRNHITQIWIAQRRQDPGNQGRNNFYIGNAMKHNVDVGIQFTGGPEYKSNHYANPFTGEIIGASSALKLIKKRKGEGIPLDVNEIAITFEGGLHQGLNLAACLSGKGLVGSNRQFYLPCPARQWEAIEAEVAVAENWELAGDQAPGKWSTYADETLKIAGSAVERNFRAGALFAASPTALAVAEARLCEDFVRPKQAVYPGTFSYPTPDEIDALMKEIESGRDEAMEAQILADLESGDET
jgi:hypothetical protein